MSQALLLQASLDPVQELPPEHRYPMRKYASAHEQLRGDRSLHDAINFQPVSPANR